MPTGPSQTVTESVVEPLDQARQRLAGVAVMLAVAFGIGATPGFLGLAAYQIALCRGVEWVWIDVARDNGSERGGPGGGGLSNSRAGGPRQLPVALAKAMRDLLTGATAAIGCDQTSVYAPVRLAGGGVSEDVRDAGVCRARCYSLFAQPPPRAA
jgi:hypothetical protein